MFEECRSIGAAEWKSKGWVRGRKYKNQPLMGPNNNPQKLKKAYGFPKLFFNKCQIRKVSLQGFRGGTRHTIKQPRHTVLSTSLFFFYLLLALPVPLLKWAVCSGKLAKRLAMCHGATTKEIERMEEGNGWNNPLWKGCCIFIILPRPHFIIQPFVYQAVGALVLRQAECHPSSRDQPPSFAWRLQLSRYSLISKVWQFWSQQRECTQRFGNLFLQEQSHMWPNQCHSGCVGHQQQEDCQGRSFNLLATPDVQPACRTLSWKLCKVFLLPRSWILLEECRAFTRP